MAVPILLEITHIHSQKETSDELLHLGSVTSSPFLQFGVLIFIKLGFG